MTNQKSQSRKPILSQEGQELEEEQLEEVAGGGGCCGKGPTLEGPQTTAPQPTSSGIRKPLAILGHTNSDYYPNPTIRGFEGGNSAVGGLAEAHRVARQIVKF